ncbi:MAG: AAA family ATPase [Bacteroidetes bacterium]|nr:AAA family ATPase [Bacteroidota bacterium]
MEKESIYFGIHFPEGFGLNKINQRKLAKLLFISPTTSAKEAKKIINNSKLILVIENLINTLSCEIECVNLTKDFDNDNIEVVQKNEKSVLNKLKDWQKEFELPTEEELKEAANELKMRSIDSQLKFIKDINFRKLENPIQIAEYLSHFIVGQQDAINTMSIIINEHRTRISSTYNLPKYSPLFIGSTGSGKSYIINKGREILDVPMIRISCGELVPAGYVGATISKFFTTLYQSIQCDSDAMSKAILVFDEFDKITKHYHSGKEGMWKTSVQLEILKLFDLNENLHFPVNHEQHSKSKEVSTNNLMLIFSGAFSGIESIILARLLEENEGNLKLIDVDNIMQYCESIDIQNYGIIPELAGRLSYICPLKNLSVDDVYGIITTAKDSELQKHKTKCELLGITLCFTDDALHLIAEKAVQKKLGARGLNSIFASLLKDVYFNSSSFFGKEFLIDQKAVLKIFTINKYPLLFKAFSQNVDFVKISQNFNLSMDEVLDLYMDWNSIK